MKYRGFTLIEILIGIALLAILLALVVAAINPAQRFQDARNTQRFSDITGIMDAINLNMLANNGVWTCATTPVNKFPTTTPTNMADGTSDPLGYDICPCLVTSGYIASMPVDPSDGDPGVPCGTYNTMYKVVQSDATKVITVNAPSAEEETISISR